MRNNAAHFRPYHQFPAFLFSSQLFGTKCTIQRNRTNVISRTRRDGLPLGIGNIRKQLVLKHRFTNSNLIPKRSVELRIYRSTSTSQRILCMIWLVHSNDCALTHSSVTAPFSKSGLHFFQFSDMLYHFQIELQSKHLHPPQRLKKVEYNFVKFLFSRNISPSF